MENKRSTKTVISLLFITGLFICNSNYAQANTDRSWSTVSGTPSGDKLNTLQYFHILAMEHGMIWVGLGEMPMQASGASSAPAKELP